MFTFFYEHSLYLCSTYNNKRNTSIALMELTLEYRERHLYVVDYAFSYR